MAVNVGTAEVEVKANLDPYIAQLQQALRLTQSFSTTANREMQGVAAATQQAGTASTAFAKAQQVASVATKGLSEAIGAVASQARASLGLLPMLAGAAGIGGIVIAAQQAVQAFGQWEQSQLTFEGRLRSTRGALGLTAQEITQLSQAISRDTLTPMEQLRGFALELGRTGEVTTDTLQRAMRILPDLTMRVGDFGQASRILSESLKNPAEAVKLLQEAGVQFNSTQRELLENTDGLAQRMQNATEVLAILERQIGGEANARGHGVAGGFSALSNAVSMFTVNIGGAIDRMFGFSETARQTAAAVDALNAALFPTSIADRVRALTADIERYTVALAAARALEEQQGAAMMAGGGGWDAEARLDRLMAGAATAAQALAGAQAQLDILHLGQAYASADQQAQALARSQELLGERFRQALKAITDQTEGLNRSRTRAEVLARNHADTLGITDPAKIQEFVQAYTALEAARRRIAQADRQTVYQRENERLEEQLQLYRYGNDELRIRAQLNRIIQAAERARQPLSPGQKEELAGNIAALDRVKQLTSTVEAAFTSLFSNMTSALSDFAVTGKFEFKKFADSVIRDMVRIAAQAFIVRPLMNAITGGTNPAIAAAMGVQFDTGPTTPIPGFAGGGSFVVPGGGGGDKPALMVGLSAGERVDITPAGKVGRMGDSKGLTVINTVNSSRDFEVSQNEREGPDGSRIIEQTFNEVVRRIGRGEADNTFGARYGMRPRTTQR